MPYHLTFRNLALSKNLQEFPGDETVGNSWILRRLWVQRGEMSFITHKMLPWPQTALCRKGESVLGFVLPSGQPFHVLLCLRRGGPDGQIHRDSSQGPALGMTCLEGQGRGRGVGEFLQMCASSICVLYGSSWVSITG